MISVEFPSPVANPGDENSLHMMCAVVKTNFKEFLAAIICCVCYIMMLQHSHYGMDPSLKFAWVRDFTSDKDKQWVSGFTYELKHSV